MPTTPYTKTNLPSEEQTSNIANITTADVESHFNKLLRSLKEIWACINGDAAGTDSNGATLGSYLNNGIVDRIEAVELYGQIKSSAILQLGYSIGGATDRAIRFIMANASTYGELFYDAANGLFKLQSQASSLLRLKVGTPTEVADATTKAYVDASSAAALASAVASIHRFKGALNGPHVEWTSVSSVTIKAGTNMRDDTDAVDIAFTSDQVVSIAAAGENGLQTGLTEASSTRYFLWYAQKIDGTKCGFLSTSASSPTLPSGYTYKRLEPTSFYNDGSSNLLNQYSSGNRLNPEVRYLVNLPPYNSTVGPTNVVDGGSNSGSYADVDVSAFVPSNSNLSIIKAESFANSQTLYIRPKGLATDFWQLSLTYNNSIILFYDKVPTDSSRIIQYRGAIVDMHVAGYIVDKYVNGL